MSLMKKLALGAALALSASAAFAQAAPSGMVQAQAFPALYHEIFNEVESQPVFDLLHDWLTARF